MHDVPSHPIVRQRPFNVLALSLVMVASLFAASVLPALSKADRKEIKKMFSDPLYLKVDAPCATGRHAWGTYKRPLVEVSKDGVNTDGDMVLSSSWWHADSTYWGVQVNDRVKMEELDIEDDDREVEVELEATESNNSTVVLFVDIDTLDDFKAAFDLVFADRPLQDQHDDWSSDMKQAVAERRLETGMIKRQVYYITGSPERFEKTSEDGKEVEIWHLRQDKGTKMGFWVAKSGEKTGFPSSVRFEDGALMDPAITGDRSTFSID